MKWLNAPYVTAMLIAISVVAIAPNLSAGADVKVFSDFLQMRDLVSDMQSKVPVTSEWSVVYCECKNGKVVALPVHGSATEVDKIVCEKQSATHGGPNHEVRVMKIAATKERVEAYKRKQDAAVTQKALDEERYRAWRSQQPATTPSATKGSVGSHDTQWMSRDDYYRQKEEEKEAKKQALKEEVKHLKDRAKKKIYENIIRNLP